MIKICRRPTDATSPGQSYSYLEENIQKLEDELDENKQSVFQKQTLINNKISENTLHIVAQQKNIDDLKEHDLQREKTLSLLQFEVNQARVLFKPALKYYFIFLNSERSARRLRRTRSSSKIRSLRSSTKIQSCVSSMKRISKSLSRSIRSLIMLTTTQMSSTVLRSSAGRRLFKVDQFKKSDQLVVNLNFAKTN